MSEWSRKMHDSDLDLEALEIAHDIFTDEELEEILLEEDAYGVDISLEEILLESEDDEYSEWAE
jgi:hypothetical protein